MIESVLAFLFGIGVGMALILLYFMAFPEQKQELGIIFEMNDLEDFNNDIVVSTKRRKLL